MTLDQICDMSYEELQKLTDQELLQHFKAYLPETRPDQVQRAKTISKVSAPAVYLSPQKKAALAALAEEGVDLSFMKKKIR